MSHENHHSHANPTLAGEIQDHTEVLAAKCYQCGKCSAGCPVSDEMDYPPSVVMRMLQTGMPEMEEKLLRSYTIWLCLTCEMCIARCPMEIDIPKVMDYLREKALKEGKANPKAKNIISFHKAFLDSIEKTGRLYEVGLVVDYKLRSLDMMQDVAIAPKMYMRGKLAILPELIKERKKIGKIFKKTLKNKEASK
jgi:heterodisulfide reductase subunit C